MKNRLLAFTPNTKRYEGGFAVTKPLMLRSNVFSINYSTSSKGYIKAILLDQKGNEIPGFGEADAEEITGDNIDGKISWKSGKTIRELADRTIRIKFVAKDADIYSFSIFDE